MQQHEAQMMDYFLRFGADAYGRTILLGANWDLFWWCVAGGLAVVTAIAVFVPLIERRKAQVARRAVGE
jgi:hypothetical protein